MISETAFFGDAETLIVTGSNFSLDWRKRFHSVAATVGSLSCTLPKAEDIGYAQVAGGIFLCIVNAGSNAFTIKDSAGGTVVSLAADKAAKLYLGTTPSNPGAWRYIILTDLD